jgi:Cro/C1-type HTH DNA-binding domain
MNAENMAVLLRAAAQRKAEREDKRTYKGEFKRYAAYRLGKEVGINTAYAYRVLHAQSMPSREILIKICRVLECSPQEAQEIMHAAGYHLSPDELDEEESAA